MLAMENEFDLAITDKLLTTTRSVRRRLDFDKPVDPDVVLDCLRVALQAPTGSNLQRWRWVVVTDEDKRKEIGRLYLDAIDPYHDIMEGLAKGNPQAEKVASSSRYLADNIHRAPILVIPCHLGTHRDMANLLGPLGYPHE